MADPQPMVDTSFRAMGCQSRLLVWGGVDPAPLRARLELLERRWSRFLPDSEISRMNRSAGRPTLVSADVLRLLLCAEHAHTITGGLFDPTMLSELQYLGYDRDHALLPVPGDDLSVDDEGAARHSPFGEIDIDPVLGAVTLPAGVALDPGGIGKGLAADMIVADAVAAGASGALLEIGGDMRIEGSWPDGGAWPVAVADPFDPDRDRLTLHVHGGGVATSSRLRRRWLDPRGSTVHHVLDPRTGRPAVSDLVAVTVHAAEAWIAEVLAKAALIAGSAPARAVLERAGVGAVLVDETGRHELVGPVDAEEWT